MAVKASALISLSCVVDVYSTTRYYLLQASNQAAPAKPTTNPPGGAWDDTEPGYTAGSTNTLYFTDLTVFSDGTWAYSLVSASSSYEAAKQANNRAAAAQQAVTSLDNSLNQQGVFNRLTNNGAAQGMFLLNGQLYVNASYISAGELSASRIHGGTLTLGGASDANGVMQVLDASGNVVGVINREGVVIGGDDLTSPSTGDSRVQLSAGALAMQEYGRDGGSGQMRWKDKLNLYVAQSTGENTLLSNAMMNIASPQGLEILSSVRESAAGFKTGRVRVEKDELTFIVTPAVGSGEASIALTPKEGGMVGDVGDVDVTGNVDIDGTLNVSGALTIGNAAAFRANIGALGASDVVNNLTGGGTAVPLSAEMGKYLYNTSGVAAFSFGQYSGYVKYVNGVLIQWGRDLIDGTMTQVASSGIYALTVQINLGVAYLDANSYVINATSRFSTGHCVPSGFSPNTAQQFSGQIYDFYARTSSTNDKFAVRWMTIGRWK